MMQNLSLLLLICLLIKVSICIADPIDSILVRSERYIRQTVPSEDIGRFIATLNNTDQWPDINYSSTQPAGWEPAIHLQRLRSMALAWSTMDSPFYHQASLKNAIDGTLEHWLEKRYQNRNWWHNEIGVPRIMKDIIILLRHDLTDNQFKQAMEVLGQHKVKGFGANLVWSADLGLHYGALARDVAMIEKCSDLITQEIKITRGEGIQPDYSYHQHGARLQTYHYGGAFLRENIKLAWELRDTPWAFPEEKIAVLVDFVLNGWQWMARGINTVPGTLDRSVSRANVLKGADLRNMVPYLCELKPAQADLFRAVNLQLKTVTGTWSSINVSGSDEPVTEKVFMPVLVHDQQSASSGYVTASCKTPEGAAALKRKPAWKVLRNDGECQAVKFNDGTFMAAFTSHTSVLIEKKKTLSANKACLVLMDRNKLWASDPTHTGVRVTIALNNKEFIVNLPEDGTSKEVTLHH